MRREYRNEVMHAAFAAVDVSGAEGSSLVRNMVRALQRFHPSKYGGWKVNRAGGKRGRRSS